MHVTIPAKKRKELFNKLKKANSAFQKVYPGDRPDRQPVHTVYGGANLFRADSAATLGSRALETFGRMRLTSSHLAVSLASRASMRSHPGQRLNRYGKTTSHAHPKKKSHPAHLSYQVYNKVMQNYHPKRSRISGLILKTVTGTG